VSRVLIFNGSPRKANCFNIQNKVVDICIKKNIDYKLFSIEDSEIKGCNHCINVCSINCALKDPLYPILNNFDYSGILLISPVYFFSLNAQTKAFIDRTNALNMNDIKFGSIITSSWGKEIGGRDIISNMLKRYTNSKNMKFVGLYHKKTYDRIEPLSIGDNFWIEYLLSKISC